MMIRMRLKLFLLSFVPAILLFTSAVSPVFAAEEMTIDKYIDEAQPYLHHSCVSAWDATDENADEYVAIINRFVAVIFINHDFDIQRIADAPEADQEALRVLFYDEIGERCAADSQKLLAGVVENSLVHAFDVMKGRGN
jgi:hypothetical protein